MAGALYKIAATLIILTLEPTFAEDQFCPSQQGELYKSPIFAYQRDLTNDYNQQEFFDWLEAQKENKAVTFCKSDAKVANLEVSFNHQSPIRGPFDCPPQGTLTRFEGKRDNQNLPKGNGRLSTLHLPETIDGTACYDMLPPISSIFGKFSKGLLEGKGKIEYIDDGSRLEATFERGVIHGKVRLFDHYDFLQGVGQYVGGLAHGPFLIHSRFYNQWIQTHFNEGKLVPENSILLDVKTKSAIFGKIVNQSYIEGTEYNIKFVGEHNCLYLMKMPDLNCSEVTTAKELPVKIVDVPEHQRIMVRPKKFLYFNRITKTGSQSLTRMMYELGKTHEYIVQPKVREFERISEFDDLASLYAEMDSILKTNVPMAFVRHYAFIDFAKFGYKWAPDWFSMVRDPVEKVISWFHYMRADWNIADKVKQFANFKPPTEEYLEKDFETCVLQGDPECQYIQDTDPEDFPGDHRSQIIHFCGHEPICRKFNNPLALQLAKANVEKHYPVVGVLEMFNQTLKLMEQKLPQYFKGAFDLYHNDLEVSKFQHKNNQTRPVSDRVKNLVRANFTYEIEFYEFCRQRLQSQFEDLHLNQYDN